MKMIVKVFSVNGLLLQEFGNTDNNQRAVSDCYWDGRDGRYKIIFDDDISGKYGYIYGRNVIVLAY
jgi:hypothetical protein